MTRYEGFSRTVVLIDVAGSASHTNPWQLRMRSDLRAMVINALSKPDFRPDEIDMTDTGDGIRMIFPPAVSPIPVLARFVPDLTMALRAHQENRPDARFRLRVAVDMGLVHRDHGWHGSPLVMCTRLCDAQPVRRALRAIEQANLVVVVSSRVYDEVVRHGYDGIDPAAYSKIEIREKETSTSAWINVPGHDTPPGIQNEAPILPDTRGTVRAPHPTVTMTATTFGNSRAYQAGGDQYIDER
jgi:hypothetical protein